MLTADLIKPRLRVRGGILTVDMIDASNVHWLRTAFELITLFQAQVGQTAAAWEKAVERYESERVDYIVVRGLAKVLADAAAFTPLDTRLDPMELRTRLFAKGPAFSSVDLFHSQTRDEILRDTAKELKMSRKNLEIGLFADRPAEYILTDVGQEWTPEALLSRYNLELSRGVLYWSSKLHLEIHDTYKDLWRYLKLFKLMFEARALEGGYSLELDGPISPFVKATTRYGRQFAAFLPALLLCEHWQMVADVRPPQGGSEVLYKLDDNTTLCGYFKRSGMFDSRLESDFAAEFEGKFGGQRGKWLLSREDEVLLLGDTVMIPDFAVTHKKTGQRVLIELVGYWHPDYLRRKVDKVRAANRRDLLLVVYEGVNLAADRLRDVPGEVVYFKNKPVLKEVIEAVERIASTAA
jgi:predicted nuclease of restriction endonuclease-like RecB superfamily